MKCSRCLRYDSCICRFISDEHMPSYRKLIWIVSAKEADITVDGDGTVTTDLPALLDIISGDL